LPLLKAPMGRQDRDQRDNRFVREQIVKFASLHAVLTEGFGPSRQ
jgi:hypothetical protein